MTTTTLPKTVYATLPSGSRVGALKDEDGHIHVWFVRGRKIGSYNPERLPGPLTPTSLIDMLTKKES